MLPSNLRKQAIKAISSFVSPGGNLLVVTRARNDHENKGAMPWPLTESEIKEFEKYGMKSSSFEDYMDNENPSIRRFRAHFTKLVNGQ